jgi:hypothetical protein
VRDVKKIASGAITNNFEFEETEGYQNLLNVFEETGNSLKRITNYKLW